jgi:hypothetical protein
MNKLSLKLLFTRYRYVRYTCLRKTSKSCTSLPASSISYNSTCPFLHCLFRIGSKSGIPIQTGISQFGSTTRNIEALIISHYAAQAGTQNKQRNLTTKRVGHQINGQPRTRSQNDFKITGMRRTGSLPKLIRR